jgi:hypothetical protein
MEEKSYAQDLRATDGSLIPSSTAIDPADRAIRCTCGKPDCPRARLRPFRDHVAELYRRDDAPCTSVPQRGFKREFSAKAGNW